MMPLRGISSPPNANGQICDAILPRHVLTWAVGQGATYGADNRMPISARSAGISLWETVAQRTTLRAVSARRWREGAMGGPDSSDPSASLRQVGSPPPRDAGQPLAGGMLPPLWRRSRSWDLSSHARSRHELRRERRLGRAHARSNGVGSAPPPHRAVAAAFAACCRFAAGPRSPSETAPARVSRRGVRQPLATRRTHAREHAVHPCPDDEAADGSPRSSPAASPRCWPSA